MNELSRIQAGGPAQTVDEFWKEYERSTFFRHERH